MYVHVRVHVHVRKKVRSLGCLSVCLSVSIMAATPPRLSPTHPEEPKCGNGGYSVTGYGRGRAGFDDGNHGTVEVG